jgi:phage tail sheath protein FI
MAEYLAPGVFVEETSFRQKTIEGVGTSTAAFVGPARFGPLSGLPELLTSFGDFERVYGGIDPLRFSDPGVVPNYLASGVRAFFENGGRRCYVSRVASTAEPPVAAAAAIGGAATGLMLQARHPGRAGNFQVTLTLRMGPNVLDPGTPTRLRGAREHDVVWIDDLDGTPNQLAALHDAFDETSSLWTFELRRDGAGADGTLGLVTELDTTTTRDVRIITVDVEIGRLGEFLDPQVHAGLSLHPPHRRSLQRVFAGADAPRATELFFPLVINAPESMDGPALAALLLGGAGAATAPVGSTWRLHLAGATEGSVEVSFGAASVTVGVDTTALAVATALGEAGLTGVTVQRPEPGTYLLTMDRQPVGAIGTNLLAGPGSVAVRAGTRFTVDTSPDGTFSLAVGGQATPAFDSDVAPGVVDDALDALFGLGDVHVVGAGSQRLLVTLWGSHTEELTIQGGAQLAADVSPNPVPILELDVRAAGGDVALGFDEAALTSVTIAQDDPNDVLTDIADALGLDAGDVAREGSTFVIRLAPASAGAVVFADPSGLVAAPGSVVPLLTRVDEPLTRPGGTAVLAVRLDGGHDGGHPDPDGYAGRGDELRKSGLTALEDLPDVSIVAAPGSTALYGEDPVRAAATVQVVGSLIRHCEHMAYRIAVVDSPPGQLPGEVLAFRGEFDSSHAALYHPWIETFDAVTRRPQPFPPSGYVCGVYARNDVSRGVHKAPANETIALAIGFEATINTRQQELLNPAGVNCLRRLDQRGRRVWGARTMSSDPEWKYVNLRRYFAYLEASIDRGTQWAVFEPNGPLLWDNVQRTVADFLLNEFANGRLLGTAPQEAFYVRCDRSTMTQNDLDNGRLVCEVGVSPLRPAEFVIFRIGQITLDAAG